MTATLPHRTVESAPPRPGPRRLALAALLCGTAALYLVDLTASGWANAYYAAAAQAGSSSWTAWLFGSSDAANAITVDKTPAALWVMGLSVRLFGLSSASVLVPQALLGVATVALLYAAVRRTSGTAAGLLAGAVLALTPVAALMFRYDNPDALLTLLLVAAAYATLRAVEAGRVRWLVLAATLVGFGFLTKMLQAFLVLPAFTAVWLLAAPLPLRRRFVGLLAAGAALVVAAGWWVLLVELWPADRRPWIGGSQTNSVLELVLGYNGLGRLTGDEVGSVGGGPGGGWGAAGPLRLLGTEMGGGIGWLLPAAVLLGAAVLWWTRRADVVLWGGWLLVTGLVFSLMNGIIHAYYTVALAPAVAALVAIGAVAAWQRRGTAAGRFVLVGAVVASVGMAAVLLWRTPAWQPWVLWTVLATGVVAVVGLAAAHRLPRAPVLMIALVAALLGPAAYTVATAATPRTGAIPAAGPEGRGGVRILAAPPPGGPGAQPGRFVGGRGMSGLLDAPTPGPELTALLSEADGHTWAAATVGSQNAAAYQLASGHPVMALGGYNGTDPFPTLAQFQQLVADGRVHWFVGGTGPGGTASGGSDTARQIAEWVAATFPATTVDGTPVHDLTAAS
ncbi:glycosyltransferase family 39 protein [Pseudonocardia sp. CA-107938]|uniref:glycosyltransferase family 39 protein n=1 Tax=Pseudonocardia sp. CA-107938 TaxID=3240021 RepID=UPI003D91D98D